MLIKIIRGWLYMKWNKCFYCDGIASWQNDFSLDDLGYFREDDEDGIISYFLCSNCGAEYEVVRKWRIDEEYEENGE